MLDRARAKNIYAALHQCDLSEQTDFADASFDAVITCETTSQMPAVSLREFARIVRPNGHIIFAVIPDAWTEYGFAQFLDELETAGKVSVEGRGAPFQMMPTTEPEFFCEIWVMRVHS